MDERTAIDRCLAGDTEAYAVIVRQYQAQILALCLRMTGNREDAADAAQQAFIQAFNYLDRYDPDQPFRPWLFKIATNQCISLLRRRGRLAVPVRDEQLEQASDPQEGAPALTELAEDRERVRRAVTSLPDPYRTVVLLYYFQSLSYQEIARQTGLPVGTISTQLHRAKAHLKRRLLQEEVGDGDTSAGRTAAAVPGR